AAAPGAAFCRSCGERLAAAPPPARAAPPPAQPAPPAEPKAAERAGRPPQPAGGEPEPSGGGLRVAAAVLACLLVAAVAAAGAYLLAAGTSGEGPAVGENAAGLGVGVGPAAIATPGGGDESRGGERSDLVP